MGQQYDCVLSSNNNEGAGYKWLFNGGSPLYSHAQPLNWRALARSHDMNSLDYYKIEELLTDEERAIRDRAAQFVQEEVSSEVVPCHRAGKFPDHLIPRMAGCAFTRHTSKSTAAQV